MPVKLKVIVSLVFFFVSAGINQDSSFFVLAAARDFIPFVNSASYEEYDSHHNLIFGGEIGYRWNSKFRVVLKAQYFSRTGYPLTFTKDYGYWQYFRDGTAFFQQCISAINFGAPFWENKTLRLSLYTVLVL